MKPLQFHADAENEAREAAARYERLRSGLGDEYRAELAASLAVIRENPQLYAVESAAIRICPLHRFPYSVYYEDLADRIWVAAIGHNSRRPGYWAGRHLT